MTATDGYVFEGGFPTAETVARSGEEADFERAVTAYRFWYPTVSVEGIFNGNREVGLADNEAIGIASTGPLQVGFTLNSDTPYGAGTLDLSDGPMVVELPPGAYIGLVDDHHQRWVMDIGIPGPDAGKGGRHLVLPPGYDGEVPDGYFVGRSSSFKCLLAVRALPLGGDIDAALTALQAVKVYPLATAEAPALARIVDMTQTALDNSSLRWEDNAGFWEVLHRIVDAEPVVDEFRPMYGLLSALGIEKGKPFAPDDRTRALLERAARVGRDQLLVSAFASSRPDRIAWPGRRWEWVGLVPDSADFETPTGLDLEARDRWFAQAIVASPAMFRRQEGSGSLYWLAARDSTGAFLDGGRSYRLDVPQPVPGKLFWSLTVYDAETRSQVKTDQNKAALRSLFELRDVPADAPTDLHVGPSPPDGDASGRWIETSAGRGWFAYIRIYGPEAPAFDGRWSLPDFERVD
jgi:hypothetical protein